MPTDLIEALAIRRKILADAQAQNTINLMCFIICLAVLILLFASSSFADSMRMIGEIEF
jgi:hypothetical protein